MATRKITISVPEERAESIKERVNARGVSACIAAAVAQPEGMDRLRELAERLEEDHGAESDDEQQAALNRIAAIDGWRDKARSGSPNPRVCGARLPGPRGSAIRAGRMRR
ncbi:hypothetical protein [Streptomyces sp. RKND-216]|uniref:hypothetical protein n=1 Tax=Streptomyces sp. RKND-216 TaxID=2562581 RepID=UPI001FF957CD|nr:hypothetical protein [Streptomyces sp. RKND-216]